MVEYKSSHLDESNHPMAYASRVEPNENEETEEWACPQCTLLNSMNVECCDACMLRKPNFFLQESICLEIEQDPEANHQVNQTALTCYTHSDNFHESKGVTEPQAEKADTTSNEEDPLEKKQRRRRRRRVRMVAGGTGGLIVGAIIVSGPAAVVVGAAAGAVGARVISKRRERRKDERLAHGRLAASVLN
jgi:hypothetical protein